MNLRREIFLCTLFGILAGQGCNNEHGASVPRDSSADSAANKSHVVNSSPESAALDPLAKPSAEQIEKWNVREYEPLELLACYDGFDDQIVLCMAIAPDRKQFVLGGSKLTLWNVKDSHPARELLTRSKTDEGESPARCVAISPDGKCIVAGDQKGTMRIWTLDGNEPAVIQAHDGHIAALAFSPDSHLLATTSYSGDVTLWQLPDGKRLKSLKMSDQEISRLEFLSDSLLAVAAGETSIWKVESGEKVSTLTAKRVTGPALALSTDRHLLAFCDADSSVQLWDAQSSKPAGTTLRGAGAHLIAFSPDGNLIATWSQDAIRIWDAATGSVVQVIDADGGPTTGLAWISRGALLVASETGRVNIWGTAAALAGLGIERIQLPKLATTPAGNHGSLSSAQLERVIDIRSFPRLPGAVPQWSNFQMCNYAVQASQRDAALFYRYCLGKSGWKEVAGLVIQPGLAFHKDDCELTVSFPLATAEGPGGDADLEVSLHFAGNYDARWLPKIYPINSNSSWDSFSSVSYRTKADLSDIEVALLKRFHDAGWTAYTRLASSGSEEPDSRHISMLQCGSQLTIFISHPADSRQELAVQTSISVTNKSLPIPPDSGWIEFDNSTDLQLVANTKMELEKTIQFFDAQMAVDGWLARDTGRHVRDGKAWLPYIRGQEQVLLHLLPLASGGTRIVVGDALASSWQLKTTHTEKGEKTEQPGIQAAAFILPAGATSVKYDMDEKRIDFELPGVAPTKLGEQFVAQMEAQNWKREGAGILSDDYTFITFSKNKCEIQLRAHGDAQKASAMISGDGLLWDQPLPAPPVRISYGTWLRRGHKEATLDLLDEFTAEMRKIPTGENGK
jgi:WD40 repeat protein